MRPFDTLESQSGAEKIYIDRKNEYYQMVEVVARGNKYSLSRGAPSTTRPPLRCGPDRRNHLGDQAFFGDFCQMSALSILQVHAAENGTPHERVGTNGTFTAQCCSRLFLFCPVKRSANGPQEREMMAMSERNKKWASELSDEDLLAEWAEVEARIANGFGEHGGSPGEWWYERADEVSRQLFKRGFEA